MEKCAWDICRHSHKEWRKALNWTQDIPTTGGMHVRIHDGVYMLIELVEAGNHVGFMYDRRFHVIQDDGSWWFKLPSTNGELSDYMETFTREELDLADEAAAAWARDRYGAP